MPDRSVRRGPVLLIAIGLLVACAVLVYGLVLRRGLTSGPPPASFLFKCPQCGHVVEWSQQAILQERSRAVQADLKAGGQGFADVDMKCPACGGLLSRARRREDGQVETLAPATSPTTRGAAPPDGA